MMKPPFFLPVAAGVLCAGLSAHDLYLRPESFRPPPGAAVRVEYHNGDRFPKSEVPVRIERLRDMKVLAGAAATPFTRLRVEGLATVAEAAAPKQAGNFLLISRTMPNFIELDPAKFEGYLQHEGLDDALAWRKQRGESAKPGREIYSKYVKAIGMAGSPSNDYQALAGLTIEFMPLANPYRLAPGGVLPVRLLVRGRPAAGLRVESSNDSGGKIHHAIVGRTDAHGEIRIPLARAGLWKLHAIYMERRQDTQRADWESFWASLTFEVPDGPSPR